MVGGEQAHHDAGGAKAALRGVRIDHGLLQRMQFAACSEVLDRDQFGAVELPQQQNAGVEGLIGEPAGLPPRQHHRAGAAIAFGAALLRSLGSHVLPQPVENGRAGREMAEFDIPAAKPKAQRVSRR